MMWDKIKITAAAMCVLTLAGTGIGWLAHGQTQQPTAQLSTEKPDKQAAPRAPKREAETKSAPASQLDAVRAELERLDKKMQQQEAQLSDEVIAARLHLMDMREALRAKEHERDFELEHMETSQKAIDKRMNELEEVVQNIESKSKEGGPLLEQAWDKLIEKRRELERGQQNIQRRSWSRHQALQPVRRRVFEAEENLRRVRLRQDQQREEYIAQRQALLARIGRLEEASLHLQPADQLRDVERRLDALRREVGELRRRLEQQKER
jgi:hypothetical protein